MQPVPPQAMRAAQFVTGAAMALFLLVGFIPAARPYTTHARVVVLAVYLLACAGLLAWSLLT